MATLTLSPADVQEIEAHGLTREAIESQFDRLRVGYPSTPITSAVSEGNGLWRLSKEAETHYVQHYRQYEGVRAKFVPASGAASRMFSKFFAFQNGKLGERPYTTSPVHFAFYEHIAECVSDKGGRALQDATNDEKDNLFIDEVLARYAHLPKALVPFHRYGADLRTPIDEHIMEGILYAQNRDGEVRIHFTVSEEHQDAIRAYFEACRPFYEEKYKVKLLLSQSIQAPCTDTIALNPQGELFRTPNGNILFRPGGHGALLHNLGEMCEDLIFIKNIDNVAKQSHLSETSVYKEMLAGVLLEVRERVFAILHQLETRSLSQEDLEAITSYCTKELGIKLPREVRTEREGLISYLTQHLNRPIRVCGMVPNEGEPGGGPFWVAEPDGSESLQIVEIAQLDRSDTKTQEIVSRSRYFNPVDIVCSIRNYKGERFDLQQFINPEMGILVHKSYNGTPLTGLEPPGLWNGAMAHWLTLFVEVPASTFTPVKEVNDLLRPSHCYDPADRELRL